MNRLIGLGALAWLCLAASPAARADDLKKQDAGAENARAPEALADKPAPAADNTARYKRLAAMLDHVRLKGRFTVVGKDDAPPEEEYTILSATKMEKGEYWMLRARIKYGKYDLTVPLPLEIQWAGETPVITLDNFTIPTLGTFDARVLLHDDKYVATWRHGKVHGHMYGVIEKAPKEDAPKEDAPKQTPPEEKKSPVDGKN